MADETDEAREIAIAAIINALWMPVSPELREQLGQMLQILDEVEE